MRKIPLVRTVTEHMVDNGIFEENILSDLVTDLPRLSQAQLELEKARIEAETEKAKIEAESSQNSKNCTRVLTPNDWEQENALWWKTEWLWPCPASPTCTSV